MEQLNDITITDQIKRDHYTDNFVHHTMRRKMEEV